MNGKTFLRIGIIILAVGALAYFILGSARVRQYEVVSEGLLYRAAVSDASEFTAAEAKVSPRTVVTSLRENQELEEPWLTVVQYAFRNHIRVSHLTVLPDGTLPASQISDALGIVIHEKHPPILLIGPDGAQPGMIAAAYRLSIEKMPLAEVEKLAELPDAPADTTRRIREFARAYDQTLRAASTQKAPTAPAATH